MPCGRKRSYYRYTPWNLESHGNAVYLDRHYARCNYGYGLSKFHLIRNGHGYYRYSIRCTNLPSRIDALPGISVMVGKMNHS